MAEVILDSYKNALLTSGANLPDLSTASCKVVLVTANHTADTTASGDAFLSDIASAERVMTTDAFTCTVSGTNVDAADGVTINDTDNGLTSSQAYLYYDTGDEATSRLIYHDDSVSITSDGTNDTLNFNASGIFDL